MSATIRPMETSDIDAVMAIECASFPTPWSRDTFVAELGREEARVWVVVEWQGGVVAYGGVAFLGDEAHLMNLAVRSDSRRMGLGSAILVTLLEAAVQRGINSATLEVRPSNVDAIRLYERTGFTSVGSRPGYYGDTREDAVIMWARDLSRRASRELRAAISARGELALTHFQPSGTLGAEGAESRPHGASDPDETLILAIETSCDETAAAVMRGGRELMSSVISSQVDFHKRFGGVVPEIASRKHTEAIVAVVDEALEKAGVSLADLDALAVTQGPGLVGALVVGLAYAKGLAFATGLPLVGVNHLEGHIFANMLADPSVEPPLVALVVSGGHTSLVDMPEWGEYRLLGQTLDDAAGEAFDKVAKLLGLGYPGGPVVSKLAAEGDPRAIAFPRAMLHSGNFDFSLSGLKTAVLNHVRRTLGAGGELNLPDLAASFQQAVIDVQVAKSVRAAEHCGVRTFCLAGGVAANAALRDALRVALEERGVRLSVPPVSLCTDNAAMIAAAAHHRLLHGPGLGLDADASPALRLG